MDLASDIARLTPQERLDLIERLWESLDDAEVPLTPAQRAELDRRIAGFDEDHDQNVGWAEFRAKLLGPS